MSGTITVSGLPAAISIGDTDLIMVVEVGSPNVSKQATAAMMRASSLPLTGGTISGTLEVTKAVTVDSGGLTVSAGGITVTGDSSVAGVFTATAGTTGNQVVNISQFPGSSSSFSVPNTSGASEVVKVGSSAASDGSGDAVVTFSAAFSTACDTIVGAPDAAAILALTASSKTGATFNLTDNAGAAVVGATVKYIAIGR